MNPTSRKSVVALAMVLTALPVKAAGIAEPALILYGSVTNTAGSLLPTAGGVNWLVGHQPPRHRSAQSIH